MKRIKNVAVAILSMGTGDLSHFSMIPRVFAFGIVVMISLVLIGSFFGFLAMLLGY
jgi:hypothetical protein